jgi:DNA-binding transcriptional ArsR family regulator
MVLTIISSQHKQESPLSILLGSKARAGVLRLFMLDPTRSYYQRQIEQATGLAIRAVQRELERLTEAGLLYRRVEGNRTYYQADVRYALFDELRGLVLKTCGPLDRLRGRLAMDAAVGLAFADAAGERVLIVAAPGRRPTVPTEMGMTATVMALEQFEEAVARHDPALDPFLKDGLDLLGRRDDAIWGRIEAAGYSVEKAEGVA